MTFYPQMLWKVYGNPPRWKAHGWTLPAKGYKTVTIDDPTLAEVLARRTGYGVEVEIEGTYPNRIVTSAKSLAPIDDDWIPDL